MRQIAVPPPSAADAAGRLALVHDVAVRLGLADVAARAEAAAAQAADGGLTVAVLGQFKAGKSSLLNSLAGRDVLPVRAVPATSVVTTVRHGRDERVTVHLATGDAGAIAGAELAEYVTAQRNPENRKGVRAVEVVTTGLAAYPDLVFVDTPGLGSVFGLDGVAATDWLPRVGVALLAVSATQPLAAADLDLLGRIGAHTPHVVVVVTKADLVTEADLADVLVFVAGELAARTGRDLTVLPYSTAPGYDEQRAALAAHLTRLEERHTEAAAVLTEHRTARLVADCRECVRVALAAAEADAAAVEGVRRALDDERRRARTALGEALALVRPYRDRAEALAVDRLAHRVPPLAARVRAELDAELATRRGSLAAETAWFADWLAQAVAAALRPEARAVAELLAPVLEEAREPLDQLGQACAQRLGGHVRRALGVAFEPPAVALATPAPQRVDVAVGAVFDSHVDTLSWAVPMALARPLVHRHFRRLVRWQVEKNALRLAYDSAAVAGRALDRLAADCASATAAQVEACASLVGRSRDEVPSLRGWLAALDGAAGP